MAAAARQSPLWAEALRRNKNDDADTVFYEMRKRDVHDPKVTDYVWSD